MRPGRRVRRTAVVAVLVAAALTASSKNDPASTSSPTTAPANAPAGAVTPLPPGPITLVALGDSLTEGAGDTDGEGGGYPTRLRRALDERGRSGSIVENLGLSGWSSTQVLEGQDDQPAQLPKALQIIADAKAAGRPAVAVVLIGSNDLWYLYANEAPTTAEEEQQDLANYRANLDRILRALTGAGAAVVIGINDDQSKRPVAADAAMRREAFSDISDAEVAMMSRQAERYAEVVRDVAAANGALVADFLRAPLFTNPATLADDGNHPNPRGYDEMSAIWLQALQPLLG